MKVNEIFYSIQGEGASSGTPAVFLRLALCNLHCWWCDTKYTWLFSKQLRKHVIEDVKRLKKRAPFDIRVYNKMEEIQEMTADEIFAQMSHYPVRRLIVTGGEPLLQQDDRELKKLLQKLHHEGWYIEVETNGTIIPKNDFVKLINQWNVSPKIESSGNEKRIREVPKASKFYSQLSNVYFKYVIDSEKDLTEVLNIIQHYGLRKENIILMPQATDPKTLLQKSRWLADTCKENSFRFSSRLHIDLWGNKRAK